MIIIIKIGLGKFVKCCNKLFVINKVYVIKILVFINFILIGVLFFFKVLFKLFELVILINWFCLESLGCFFFKWLSKLEYIIVKKLLIMVVGINCFINCLFGNLVMVL